MFPIVQQAQVWAPSGLNLRIGLWGFYTDASNAQIGSYVTFTGTGALQLVKVTGTSNGAKTLASVRVQVILNGAQSAGDFWVDAHQAEAKGYATSLAIGDMGTGYAFTGTAHASTSTRAASSAAIDPTGILSPSTGAVAFWATRQIDTNSEEYWIIAGSGGSGNDLFFASITNDRLDHKWNCDNAGVDEDNSGADFPVGVPTFFIMGWDGTTTYTKQGGQSLQSGVRNTPADNWGDDTFTLQCSAGGVIFHELAFFSEMPTDSQVAVLESTMNWSMSTLSGSSRIASQFQLRPY